LKQVRQCQAIGKNGCSKNANNKFFGFQRSIPISVYKSLTTILAETNFSDKTITLRWVKKSSIFKKTET